jgi:hypothetical protein
VFVISLWFAKLAGYRAKTVDVCHNIATNEDQP